MSNCCNDTPIVGCTDCTTQLTYLDTFCQTGCEDYPPSDCVLYSGDAITGPIAIANGETLTSIIKKLVGANASNGVDITFTAGSLCLKNNGTTIRCVTIPDSDDQYLELDPTTKILSIWKPGDSPVKINQVDLSAIFTETSFAMTSNSLVVTPGGIHGHSPIVEIVPSTDVNNAFQLGSDHKPFVPIVNVPITSIVFPTTPGITRTLVNVAGVVTVTETLDFNYIASQVCPLCTPSCQPPTNLVVTS